MDRKWGRNCNWVGIKSDLESGRNWVGVRVGLGSDLVSGWKWIVVRFGSDWDWVGIGSGFGIVRLESGLKLEWLEWYWVGIGLELNRTWV